MERLLRRRGRGAGANVIEGWSMVMDSTMGGWGVCRPRKVIFSNMTREVEMSEREDNSEDRGKAQSNGCFPSCLF